MHKSVKNVARYMTGLDGLRALAVLAVIAYHLDVEFARGGLLGVGVFFVLSGYLITDLLIAEWRNHERINLKHFWIRRARRLLPAFFAMLAVVVLGIAFFQPAQWHTVKGDILPSIFYVSNWWNIFHEVSYFESFGPPSPLGHLWSLAVEEQFYLLWPLLLLLALRFAPTRGKLIGWTLLGAAVSALAMAVLFVPGEDSSRIYYGTDTRAFALIIGAVLAIVWPSAKLPAYRSRLCRLLLEGIGAAGLVVMLAMIWKTSEYDPFLYQGGLVLLSLASAAIIAALAHPATTFGRLFSWAPLRWLGVRSYGIYLWHYPVILLIQPAVRAGESSILLTGAQICLSIGLAALSWRYIENPIRHGALGRFAARWREQRWVYNHRNGIAAAGMMLLLILVGLFAAKALEPSATFASKTVGAEHGVNQGLAYIQQNSKPGTVMNDRRDLEHPAEVDIRNSEAHQGHPVNVGIRDSVADVEFHEHGADVTDAENRDSIADMVDAKIRDSAADTAEENVRNPTEYTAAEEGAVGGSEHAERASDQADRQGAAPEPSSGITVIGDSVILDAAPYLESLFPGILIDGKVGRQMKEAQEVVEQLAEAGQLGEDVIIELGTNGIFTRDQMESLLEAIGTERRIYLINIRVPRKWEGAVNRSLADLAKDFPDITLIDWYKASKNKHDFFSKDGVHLNKEGAEFYASLLADALQPSS